MNSSRIRIRSGPFCCHGGPSLSVQDRGPFSLGLLPGGQSPPSSVCPLSPEEEGRRVWGEA